MDGVHRTDPSPQTTSELSDSVQAKKMAGFDVTAAVIDVPAIDCTGSALMDQIRIN